MTADDARGPDARFWKATMLRIAALLAVWFTVGPLMGIVFAEPLNRFSIAGVPFGFWMAQQGSIYVFVVLIFVYAALASRAEHRHGGRD